MTSKIYFSHQFPGPPLGASGKSDKPSCRKAETNGVCLVGVRPGGSRSRMTACLVGQLALTVSTDRDKEGRMLRSTASTAVSLRLAPDSYRFCTSVSRDLVARMPAQLRMRFSKPAIRSDRFPGRLCFQRPKCSGVGTMRINP